MGGRLNPKRDRSPVICSDCGAVLTRGDAGAEPRFGCCHRCRCKHGSKRALETIRKNGPFGRVPGRRLDYSREG